MYCLVLAHDFAVPDQSHITPNPGTVLKYDLWRNVDRYGSPVPRLQLQFCSKEWARRVPDADPLYFSVFAPSGLALHRQALGQMQVDEINEMKLRELACLDVPNQDGVTYYADKVRTYGPIFVDILSWPRIFPSAVDGRVVDARLSKDGNELVILLPQNCLLRDMYLIHPKAVQYRIHPRVHIHATLPPTDEPSDSGSQVSTANSLAANPWDNIYTYKYEQPSSSRPDTSHTPTHVMSQVVPDPFEPLVFASTIVQASVTETVQLTQTVIYISHHLIFLRKCKPLSSSLW